MLDGAGKSQIFFTKIDTVLLFNAALQPNLSFSFHDPKPKIRIVLQSVPIECVCGLPLASNLTRSEYVKKKKKRWC